MLQGTTKSGFAYEIEDERLNNYELVEAIGELEEYPVAISKVVNLLLGKKQAEDLKNHVRSEDGFVPSEKINEEIMDIFNAHGQIKNS